MRRTLLTTAAIAGSLLILAIAVDRRASARPEALPAGSFHVDAEDIIKDDGAIVSRIEIEIEVRSGSMVRLVGDRPLQGGASCRAGDSRDLDREASTAIVTVLGDLVDFSGKKVRKLRVGIISGAASAVFSDTGPSATPGKLGDLLSIPLKSGTYREGDAIPAIHFEDKTYNLVVDAPKP